MNLLNRNRLTGLEKELMVVRVWEGIVRELVMVPYTLLYLQWITHKDLLNSTWNSAQCDVAAGMGGASAEKWIHVYVWLLPLLSRFSRARLCAAPWTAAHQAPPSLGFSRREYWSGLPLPSPT